MSDIRNKFGQFKEGHTPWIKGKRHSLEARKKMSIANKGKILSPKTKKKISKSLIGNKRCVGRVPWNKGLKGYMAGKKHWCWGKQRNDIRGEKNTNWKGGITSQSRLDRIRFKRTIQQKIFERDNFTCQICGSNKDLQVDHIQAWADYIELRFSLDNCRTVCAKCHYKITFGKPMPKNIHGWGHNLLEVERRVTT